MIKLAFCDDKISEFAVQSYTVGAYLEHAFQNRQVMA